MVDPTKAFQSILDAIGEGKKAAGAFPKPKKSFTEIVKGALDKKDEPAPPPPAQLPAPPKPTPSFPGQAPPAPPAPPKKPILDEINDILQSIGQQKAEPLPPKMPNEIDALFKQISDKVSEIPKSPVNIWTLTDQEIKTNLKPGDFVTAGEGGVAGTYQGISPGGAIMVDWKTGPTTGPKPAFPGAVGPPKTPTYGQTGQVPIKEAPPGETKIPVGESVGAPSLPNGFVLEKVGDGYGVKKASTGLFVTLSHKADPKDAVDLFYNQHPHYKPGQPETKPAKTLLEKHDIHPAYDPGALPPTVKPPTMHPDVLPEAERQEARREGGYLQEAFRGVHVHPGKDFQGIFEGPEHYASASTKLADMYSSYLSKHPGAHPTEWSYSEGASAVPLWIDTRAYHQYDGKGKQWQQVNAKAMAEAKNMGKKGVIIDNVWDEPSSTTSLGKPQRIFITFSNGMSTVKSKFAARFDPKSKDISRVMVPAMGVTGAAGAIAFGATSEAKAEEGQKPSFEEIVKKSLGQPSEAPAGPAKPPANFMDTVTKSLADQKKAETPQAVDSRVSRAMKILQEGVASSATAEDGDFGFLEKPMQFFRERAFKPAEEETTIPGKATGSMSDFTSQWGTDIADIAKAGQKEVETGIKEMLAPFSHEKLAAYNKYQEDLRHWESMGDLEREVVPKPERPEGTGGAAVMKGMLTGLGGAWTYATSPATGLIRTGVARPLEETTGLRHELTEFVGGLALPGEVAGVIKLKNTFGTVGKGADFIAANVNKVFAPEKLGKGADAATLLRAGTGTAARFTEQARSAFNDYWNAVDAMSDAEKLGLTAYIEGRTGGAKLKDPSLQPVADAFRDQMETRKTLLQNSPITAQMSFVEDYYPHMGWEDPAAAKSFIQNWFTKQGFGKNIKERIIPTIADGIAAGLKPITYNPLEMGMMYIQNMDRFIAHNNVFAAGRAAGHIKYALGDKNPAMAAKGWVPLSGRLSTKKTPAGEMTAYAPEEFARVYNNFVGGGFHGVQGPYGPAIGATYDKLQHASNTITGMELGLSGFHLFNEVNEAMASEAALALAQASGALGALKGGEFREAARLLAGSAVSLVKTPLAPVTKAITGHKGQNIYLGRSPGTAQNKEIIDLLEMGGGRAVGTHGQELEFRQTVGKSYLNSFRKLSDFIDSRAWKATGKSFQADYKAGKVFPAPVAFVARQVGRTLATFADPLFKTYIPKLKTGAFMDNMKVWLEANPNAAYPEKIAMAQKIWNSIDNRMGEMVQDNIFWPNMLKQSAKLGMRSFSWTLGTAREIAGGAKGLVTKPSSLSVRGSGYDPKTGYVIAMPMVYFMANAAYQYMKTGKPPESIDDVLHGRTGGVVPGLAGRGAVPERITLPSQMKDVFGWYEDWRREAYAKLSGMTQAGWELATNRDWKNDPIINPESSAPDWLKDYFKYAERFLPISVRTEIQGEKRGSKITPTERRLGLRPAGTQWTDPEGLRRFKRYQSMQLEKKRKKQEKRQQSIYGGSE